MREMNAEEKALFHCDEFESQMFAGSSGGAAGKGIRRVNPEVAIKIVVKKKEDND